MTFTEQGDAFAPRQSTDGQGSVIPMPFVICARGIFSNIHRGTRGAKEDAYAFGLGSQALVAHGFFPAAAASWLVSGVIIALYTNELWRVALMPEIRTRFPATSHCKALLIRESVRPTGVWIYESSEASMAAHVSVS